MSLTMFPVDIASQICPIIAILGVLILFYSITYRAAQFEMRQSDLLVYILLVSFTLIIFSPRYMTNNQEMICVFGFLWVPQIITNIFEHPAWRFNYSFSFSLIQSIYFIFPPLYARGFHNNFYFLKPDPMPVRALLFLYLT